MEKEKYRTHARVDGEIYLRVYGKEYQKSVAMARIYFRRDIRLIFLSRAQKFIMRVIFVKCFIHTRAIADLFNFKKIA